MKNQFTIASAYDWGKDENGKNNSELAMKTIAHMIKNRFSNKKDEKFIYSINYRRLRASAGRTMLGSIIKRIKESQVIIIDISKPNGNVFLEAGMALSLELNNKYLSIYFIREQVENVNLPEGIPSDLQGYFISEYKVEKGNVTFKDGGSLRMSIESDVKEYFNAHTLFFDQIDELNIEE